MGIQLEYENADGWSPLPEWARFLWATGEILADCMAGSPATLPVLVLSLPTRMHAAPLVLGGYFAVKSGLDQFHGTTCLSPGTSVIYGTKKKYYQAVVQRVNVQRPEGLFIELRVTADGGTHLVRAERGAGFRLLPGVFRPGKNPKPARVVSAGSFAGAVLRGDAADHAARTCLDCVLVGPRGHLLAELEDTLFRPAGTPPASGHLGELIRPQRGKEPWRTKILGPRDDVEHELEGQRPRLWVYDGTPALRRWRHLLRPDAGAVAILDRSAHDHDDGVDLLTALGQDEGWYRRPFAAALGPPPEGIVVGAFSRAA